MRLVANLKVKIKIGDDVYSKPCHHHSEVLFSLTRVPTLLNALSPVRDACSRVSWVDDVALVACGTVEWLVSILSCTAGLS